MPLTFKFRQLCRPPTLKLSHAASFVQFQQTERRTFKNTHAGTYSRATRPFNQIASLETEGSGNRFSCCDQMLSAIGNPNCETDTCLSAIMSFAATKVSLHSLEQALAAAQDDRSSWVGCSCVSKPASKAILDRGQACWVKRKWVSGVSADPFQSRSAMKKNSWNTTTVLHAKPNVQNQSTGLKA